MAKQVNKAYIKFKLNKKDPEFTQLRFHSVIMEDHEVTNTVTKFPVQSGYDVSNHSIRKNRVVKLRAIITDTQLVVSKEFHEYSPTSNSRAVFSLMKKIVREAVPCEVVTNLDTYKPVIFTSFKTQQKEGMTDAMELVLTGEEIQLAKTKNKSKPAELLFTPVPEEERASKIAELREAGYEVSDEVDISVATVDLNEGFSFTTISTSGQGSKVTYDKIGSDPTTGEFNYECSISPDGTVKGADDEPILPGGEASARLANGAQVFGNCLVEQGVGLATEVADEYITTAMGDLKKTIYGGLYEILGVNGNRSFGQRLLALGLDCFICGATATNFDADGNPRITPDDFDTTLPTKDDVLKGAAGHGDSLVTDSLSQSSPTTITKLSGSSVGTTNFLGELL